MAEKPQLGHSSDFNPACVSDLSKKNHNLSTHISYYPLGQIAIER